MAAFWRVAVPAVAAVADPPLVGGPPTSASAADAVILQARPVTSSSAGNSGLLPPGAVDGDPTTRWASAWSDPQWLQCNSRGYDEAHPEARQR